MKILPRSAKGTWLLAVAAWVALCALLWWLLPVVPAASWTLPEPSELRFSTSGEMYTSTSRSYPSVDLVIPPQGLPIIPPDGPIRVWDPATGRLLRTYPPDDKTVLPPDQPFPAPPPDTGFEAVSRDGRLVAASVKIGDTVSEIGVWEVGSLRRLGTFPLPEGIDFVRCELNSQGTILAAYLSGVEHKPFGVICWDTATGRELLRIRDASTFGMALSADGNTLLHITDLPDENDVVPYRLSVWDVPTAHERFSLKLKCDLLIMGSRSALISPDGRTIAAPTGRGPWDPLGNLARRLGISWPFGKLSTGEFMTLFDATTGKELGSVSGKLDESVWSPDGKLLATLDEYRHLVRIWDIPPRKPLTWFGVTAAVLALPPAGLGWRRSRRLRREVA